MYKIINNGQMVRKYQDKHGHWRTELEPGEEYKGKPLSVALPKSIEKYIRNKPNRSDWMREVLVAAVLN
ncbi:MAG: hypothetical protein F6K24_06165 [Okeania sp. SIO2D1]|nr:hypothetical protein [Okeania sp. SIO2D1]